MRLDVQEMQLSLAALPRAWDGVRLAQISDLHLFRRPGPLENEVRARIVSENPNLLFFSGDAVIFPRHWPRVIDWLSSLKARAGAFAVPGNWDYRGRARVDEIEGCYRQAGFIPLINTAHRLERGGSSLYIVGFDDVRRGHPDPDRAYAGVPETAFSIAMCHNPDILRKIFRPRFNLLLCGHTHGGQIRLPGFGALFTSTRLGRKYAAGLYPLVDGRFLYVNRGLGRIGPPFRLFCPPELTLLTLRCPMP